MAGDGLPDGGHPRPAPGRDRRRARRPARPRGRTATSTRCSTASGPRSRSGSPTAATRCGSTSPTARSGTATWCAGWPSGRPTRCSSSRALRRRKGLSRWRTVAIFGAGVMGETLLSGLIRSGRGADDLVVTERRPDRAERADRALRRRRRRQRRGGGGRRHPRAGRQAAGHGRPARRRSRDAPARRARSSSPSPPASPPTSSRAGCPTGTAVVRVMPNTPALVDEGMAAISPGQHCDDGAPRRGRGAAALVRQGRPGRREAPGRRHRDQRLRTGVHLLRRRGDDRGGRPARPAARDRPPSSSSRPCTAPRRCSRRPASTRPCCASRCPAPAGTTDGRAAPARRPQGARGVPHRDGGRGRTVRPARLGS